MFEEFLLPLWYMRVLDGGEFNVELCWAAFPHHKFVSESAACELQAYRHGLSGVVLGTRSVSGGSPLTRPRRSKRGRCPAELVDPKVAPKVILTVSSIHFLGWRLDKRLGVMMAALYGLFLTIALSTEFGHPTWLMWGSIDEGRTCDVICCAEPARCWGPGHRRHRSKHSHAVSRISPGPRHAPEPCAQHARRGLLGGQLLLLRASAKRSSTRLRRLHLIGVREFDHTLRCAFDPIFQHPVPNTRRSLYPRVPAPFRRALHIAQTFLRTLVVIIVCE